MYSNINKQQGFFQLPNDNILKTFIVAILLCLVCSIIVSTAAVKLKPLQEVNKLLDKKKNILSVSGLGNADDANTVEKLFSQIDTRVIDVATGKYTDLVDSASYDQRKAANASEFRVELTQEQDIANIGGRAKYANVYLVKTEKGDIKKIILPIKGYGLWGTLYGFIALESDAQTVSGITFYEHKETAGLGGEVDNPNWKSLWKGKKIGENGQVLLSVIKGKVGANTKNGQYKVDGLAGASLTSKGVSNLIQFWLGKHGFGPFLKEQTSVFNQQSGDT